MTLRDALGSTISAVDAAGDYRFGDAAAEFTLARNDVCLSPRLEHSVVRVSGADSRTFLQAQLTTNLLQRDSRGALSAWCTPQGRITYQFHLLPEDGGYLLVLPTSEAARFIQRLRLYVLRAKVTIEDVSASHGVVGLSVPRGVTPLPLAALTSSRHAVSRLGESLRALCIDDSARYLVCGELPALLTWSRACGLPPVGSAAWRWLDIQQGHLDIAGALANEFLPQQLNLDMVEALAFDKGCYPGQEVIARLRYRGEVKSRLLRGHADGTVIAGARLRSGAANHRVGQIVTAVTLPALTTDFLAVVELAALPAVQLEDAPTLALSFESPPYWHL